MVAVAIRPEFTVSPHVSIFTLFVTKKNIYSITVMNTEVRASKVWVLPLANCVTLHEFP